MIQFSLRFKFIVAAVLVCFSVLFNFLNVLDTNPANKIKWDGVHYNSIVVEYINGGYSFEAIKGKGVEDNFSREE